MRVASPAPGLAGLLVATALLTAVPPAAGAAVPRQASAGPGDRDGDGLIDLVDPHPDHPGPGATAPPPTDATVPTVSVELGRRSSSVPPDGVTVRMADPETRLHQASLVVRRTVRVRGRGRTETFDGRRWRSGHPWTIDRSRAVRGRAKATVRVRLTGLRPGTYVVQVAVTNGARAMTRRTARFRVR